MKITKLNEKQKKYIIESYYTKSSTKLAKELNCSSSLIKKIWRINNLKGKGCRVYYSNFDYFEKIDNEHKAYWLGFIAADGCVYSRDNHQSLLSISLNVDDIDMLNNFKEDIESENKVRKWTDSYGYNYCGIQIVSDKLCSDLRKYNIVERKTETYVPFKLKDEYMRHFIRGFFDGDGSFYIESSNKNMLVSNFCGNYNCMNFIKEYLENYNINFHLRRDNREYSFPFYYLRLTKHDEMKRFIDFLYNKSTIYMERKYKIAQRYLKLKAA